MTKRSGPRVWDQHSIKAEVHRRGMTLTGIAINAGLSESACRKALFGLSRPGADAIASALDIPFEELFPTGYIRSRNRRDDRSGNERSSKRQKQADGSANRRASA